MSTITKPNTFTPGTTIQSSQVNANFDTIYNDYNGNQTNANIAPGAAIAASKLNLSTIAQTIAMSGQPINFSEGGALASATTVNIGAATGNSLHITGTTTITGFDTVQAGTWRYLIFDGALTFTHNSTSLILPTGANITTAAGDTAFMMSEGSGNWRCLAYNLKSGSALNVTTVSWADYSATSTIVGWASFSTKAIYTKKVGTSVFVSFNLLGTSNDVTATFTVPYSAVNSAGITFGGPILQAQDNGTLTSSATVSLPLNSQLVSSSKSSGITAVQWTNSGTKQLLGSFWYEAAS